MGRDERKQGHRLRGPARAVAQQQLVDLPGLLDPQAPEREGGAVGGEGEAHPAGVRGEGSAPKADYLDVAVFDVVPDVRKPAVVDLDVVLLQCDTAPVDSHESFGQRYQQPGRRHSEPHIQTEAG